MSSTIEVVRESSAYVLGVFLFAAAFRVAFGYTPPLGEAAIGAMVSIAGFNTARGAYQDFQSFQVRKLTVASSQAGPPQDTTPPP